MRYDPETRDVDRLAGDAYSLLNVQGRIEGQGGWLWLPCQNGLLAYNLEADLWHRLQPGTRPGAVHEIVGELNRTLLVDSDQGLGFWDPDSGQWQPLQLPADLGRESPIGVALERGGQSIWLTSLLAVAPGEGHSEATGGPQLYYYSEPGARPQQIEMVAPAGWELRQLLPTAVGSTLWFIGDQGFLSYNPAVNQWGVFAAPIDTLPPVRHAQQQENTVWFVTDTDLGRFDMVTGEFLLIPLPSFSMTGHPALAVGSGAVWFLADSALSRTLLDDVEWVLVSAGAPCLNEASQLAMWNEALWVGGALGVGRLDTAADATGSELSDAWTCFSPGDGMLDLEIDQLLPGRNALWFVNREQGVWRYVER